MAAYFSQVSLDTPGVTQNFSPISSGTYNFTVTNNTTVLTFAVVFVSSTFILAVSLAPGETFEKKGVVVNAGLPGAYCVYASPGNTVDCFISGLTA